MRVLGTAMRTDHKWDPGSCQCVCAPSFDCGEPFFLDTDSCACVCGLQGCDRGSTLDPVKCVCNPNDPCSTAPACPDGMIQDKQTCQCYCPDGKPICDANCLDQSSANCGTCGNSCKFGCCQGQCCIG